MWIHRHSKIYYENHFVNHKFLCIHKKNNDNINALLCTFQSKSKPIKMKHESKSLTTDVSVEGLMTLSFSKQ